MAEFLEFEIKEFEGEASSNRNPSKNQCQLCRNFDTRFIKGDLTVRPGFVQKYAAPVSADHRSKLSSFSYLGFDNFYVPDNNGQEITIWVARATLAAENGIGNGTPIARPILTIFSSHQFNGTSWGAKNWDGITDGKYWLNDTVITTISGSSTDNEVILDFIGTTDLTGSIDTTASVNVLGVNTLFLTQLKVGDRILVGTELRVVATITDNTHLTVTVAFTDQANDTTLKKLLNFDGWTIINITKSPYEIAQVIETYDAGSGQIGVRITNNSHSWTDIAPDEIVLMKNYIPYDHLLEMANTTAAELTFHNVLNDLRIGFGGKANRIGLSIGYRKHYLKLSGIEFGSFISFYEPLSTVNNLILDTYIPISDNDGYKIISTAIPGYGSDELPAGKYFFRLTAILDDYSEFLVAENFIITEASYSLKIEPQIKLGGLNRRITKLRLYGATTNSPTDIIPTNPYFFLKEFLLREKTYVPEIWQLKPDGFLYLSDARTEMHTDANAANLTEVDGTAGFTVTTGLGTLSVAGAGKTDTTAAANGSLWWLKCANASGSAIQTLEMFLTHSGLFERYKKYEISFYAKANPVTLGQTYTLKVQYQSSQNSFTLTTAWQRFSIIFDNHNSPSLDRLVFVVSYYPYGLIAPTASFGIDELSIKLFDDNYYDTSNLPGDNAEMTARMGYEPTFDMVKSWDQAVVTSGRTLLVGAYIDKKYGNFILASHISGAPAFMYDVITAEKSIETSGKDEVVGIEVLPNLDLLILKKNSVEYADPNTGQKRGIYFIDGAISRRSIINFGDKVMWCGENDIYVSDGLNVLPITDGTIREAYRALANKQNIIAVREEKDNAYRFFTADTTNRTEYILTKVGFISRVMATIYPDAYLTGRDGTVWFMRNGIIYTDVDGTIQNDNGTNISEPTWRSIEFDIDRMGEGITETEYFYIRSMWIDYSKHIGGGIAPTMRMSIVVDGSKVYTKDFAADLTGRNKLPIKIWPTGISGRRFYIEVSVLDSSDVIRGKHISIHSVGVKWRPRKSGWFN